MNSMVKKELLKGAVISMPAFTKKNYELDIDRFKSHVSWLIDEGLIEGKAVLMGAGGFAPGYLLTADEHERMMKAMVDAANGRVPTMTAIYDRVPEDAVNRAKLAEDIGVDFIQVGPPYFLTPTDDEVYEYYRAINDNAEVGIMLYNTPYLVPYEFTPKILERLVDLDNAVAVKWMSFNIVNFITVLKQFSNRITFIDNSDLMSLVFQLGGKGYISLIGNIAPKADLHLLDLLERKAYEQFDEEFAKLNVYGEVMGSAEGKSFQGIGEATIVSALFDALGRDIGPPKPPQRRATLDEIHRIREVLKKNPELTRWIS